MNNVRSAIRSYSDRLEKAGVFSPERDATSIMAHVLGVEDDQVFDMLDRELSLETLAKTETSINRRASREPLHRILGHINFCGLKIHVADGVFRPCHEAEYLVEVATSFLEEKRNEPIRILDLGTGSGCILLSLLKALPHATGVGVDIEEHILEAARTNANENGLSDRASFQISDWGHDIEGPFDFIIANPPAIATENIPYYPPEMRDYNPFVSLDGGKDGLRFYRSFVKDFERLTKPGALGVFRVYSECREASIFDGAGFPVRMATDFLGHAYCMIVTNEKRKHAWLRRVLAIL